MRQVSAQELQRNIGAVQDLALAEPVAITHHGRERLVLLSVEEYRRLKSRDRRAFGVEDLSPEVIEAVAAAEMDARFNNLDALLD
ncbi:MAG: type II toxin-antitoxin system Phd/YefM family antitoxin [Alphaproteobacteria bacterium]|nr:type II toxin-antitoxin system Phd/YefM family antitoxin [Alphaproteobacteria bacterium]